MIDPVTPDGKDMVEYIKLFLDHNVPARLGVLLLPSNDEGVSLSQGFVQLVRDKSPRDAFKWFNKVSKPREREIDVHALDYSKKGPDTYN